MKTVLVTGASRGIGLETALEFARAGYEVFAAMRSPEAAPQLKETAASEDLRVSVVQMDVDSDASVRACFSKLPALDVLVNNAGVEFIGSVEETPLEVFRSVMETNYFGVLRCVQAVAGAMRARGSGCIVNVSSVAGRLSLPPMAPYCASKWALEALTEALAGEMKTFGVRALLVEPGIIDTAMARRIGEPKPASAYGQSARCAMMFQGSLQRPVPPSLVSARIVELVETGTWQLRHLVGPDTGPFLAWRASMNDEQWVDVNAGDDAGFFSSIGGPA